MRSAGEVAFDVAIRGNRLHGIGAAGAWLLGFGHRIRWPAVRRGAVSHADADLEEASPLPQTPERRKIDGLGAWVDGDGGCGRASVELAQCLGLTPEDIEGRPIAEIFGPAHATALGAAVSTARARSCSGKAWVGW